MTRFDRIDDALAAWLASEAAAPAPPGLLEQVSDATVGRRPRRAWSATLRQAGVSSATGWSGVVPGGRLGWIALVALLGAAIVAAVLVVGSRPEQQAPPRLMPIQPSPLLERSGQAAVSTTDGRVLVVGGQRGGLPVADAALLDPTTGETKAIPTLEARGDGTVATLLDDGRVLVTGGRSAGPADDEAGLLASAEILDPRTGDVSAVGAMAGGRGALDIGGVLMPVALHLGDGRVVILGGGGAMVSPAEPLGDIFDPVTDTFSQTPPIPCAAEGDSGVWDVRTAARLWGDHLLLACERRGGGGTPQVVLSYDVASGTFEPLDIGVGTIRTALELSDRSLMLGDASGLQHFDPLSTVTDGGGSGILPGAAAVTLPDGRYLLIGGGDPAGSRIQLVDPVFVEASTIGQLTTPRTGATATDLGDGRILVIGGTTGAGEDLAFAPPEVVDVSTIPAPTCPRDSEPAAEGTPPPLPEGISPGSFAPTGSLQMARSSMDVAPLADGRVVVIGGTDLESNEPVTAVEILDDGAFHVAGSLDDAPYSPSVAPLPDGRVLMAGGRDEGRGESGEPPWRDTAVVFDPATGASTPTRGRMSHGGYRRPSVVLPDGRVLIAGWESVELYDRRSGTFRRATGQVPPNVEAATLMADGRVLLVGSDRQPSAVFDPDMDTLTPTGSPVQRRSQFWSAVALADGRALATGGLDGCGGRALRSAEIYDPATNTFSPTGSMTFGREGHSMWLRPDGTVPVAGGFAWPVDTAGPEIFDPATGTFHPVTLDGPPPDFMNSYLSLAPLGADRMLVLSDGHPEAWIYSAE